MGSDSTLPSLRRSEMCLDIPEFLLREKGNYSFTSLKYSYTKVKERVKIEASHTHI